MRSQAGGDKAVLSAFPQGDRVTWRAGLVADRTFSDPPEPATHDDSSEQHLGMHLYRLPQEFLVNPPSKLIHSQRTFRGGRNSWSGTATILFDNARTGQVVAYHLLRTEPVT
jgi:hypothetical protein